jgi:hypothetical protein
MVPGDDVRLHVRRAEHFSQLIFKFASQDGVSHFRPFPPFPETTANVYNVAVTAT